jgi:tRNA (cmo5U34)-methyltransferase
VPSSDASHTYFEEEIVMTTSAAESAAKFDTSRAGEYEQQSRIALAGYDACHELTTCMLAASLGNKSTAHILVVGAGGPAKEITNAGKLEPNWRFTAVDPSQPMLDIAMTRIAEAGLMERTTIHLGRIEDLPHDAAFDAATLVGVLHHLPGNDAKRKILKAIAARLKPGAPFILAGNHFAYASQPLLLEAWAQRWRMQGATPDEVSAKLGKILQGADPPHSEEAVAALLADAGFDEPLRFFSSLFWGAWIARSVSEYSRPGLRSAVQA